MASLVKTDKISKIAGGSQEFTLPGADGTANQHLKTDGSGVLGWASAPSITGSTNTWIPTITGANALTGTANFTYDGNVLDVKNSGTASSINLYCESSNAHYIKIKSGENIFVYQIEGIKKITKEINTEESSNIKNKTFSASMGVSSKLSSILDFFSSFGIVEKNSISEISGSPIIFSALYIFQLFIIFSIF